MTIELKSGKRRATFTTDDSGMFMPGWFYQEDCPVMRFKKHEWTSVGHLKINFMHLEYSDDKSVRFTGETSYGEAKIGVEVEVTTDPMGFWVKTRLTTDLEVELQEAGTSFDVPFEYDGLESATSIIGGQPVVKWDAGREITPPGWHNPQWSYNSPESARCTKPCWNPYVALELRDGVHDRRVALVGDWNNSHFQEIFTSPSKYYLDDNGKRHSASGSGLYRNYKLICGALNWASSISKDPNVLVRPGETISQRVLVTWEEDLSRPVDKWLFKLWSKALGLSMTTDGRVTVGDTYRAMDIDYPTMAAGIQGILRQKMVSGIWDEDKGIVVYAEGTRPKGAGTSALVNIMWAADSYQYARIRGEKSDRIRALDLIRNFWPANSHTRGSVDRVPFDIYHITNLFIGVTEETRPILVEGLAGYLAHIQSFYLGDDEHLHSMDQGNMCTFGRLLYHGAVLLEDDELRIHSKHMIDLSIATLSENYWHCAMNKDGGGNIRPPALAAAALGALDLFLDTGEEHYRQMMIRFLRLVFAINVHSFDGIGHPDLDSRGWCNGANGGRDQMAELPPWESSVPLRAMAAALPYWPEAPVAAWNILHVAATTTIGQVPAARTHRFAYTLDGKRELRSIGMNPARFSFAKNFYNPWLAYENPYDQTMAAGYQGAEILDNALSFGGALISANHPAVTVVVPEAATWRIDTTLPITIFIGNASSEAIETTLCWFLGCAGTWKLDLENEKSLYSDKNGCCHLKLASNQLIRAQAQILYS